MRRIRRRRFEDLPSAARALARLTRRLRDFEPPIHFRPVPRPKRR